MEERLRRTMMFVPGNNAGMVKDAGIYGADSIMFDLEDSVSMAEKDAARMLVYQALQTQDYGDSELVVRVNGIDTPFFKNDVFAMVKAGIQVVRLPKVESAQMMLDLVKVVEEVRASSGTVSKIADAAEEQASAVEQVSVGIDQISSVVQTNSSTAVESAAASQELSSQADLLKDLVARFILREEYTHTGLNVDSGYHEGTAANSINLD